MEYIDDNLMKETKTVSIFLYDKYLHCKEIDFNHEN